MRRIVFSVGILLMCIGRVNAGTINLSTGLNTYGNVLSSSGAADANWIVQQAVGGTASAQAVFPGSPDWGPGVNGIGAWVANDANSTWIARNASDQHQGAGTYSFYRTFDMTGYDLSAVAISGSWAADDTGVITLNGHEVASLPSAPGSGGVASNWDRLHSFYAADPSFFNQGSNTLAITIVNADGEIDGVRLNATLTSTPEPSSFALFVIGITSLLAYSWRRRRMS